MTQRVIQSRARHGTVQLLECVQSLFALELLLPSPVLYLMSPWIGDIVVITDRVGTFRDLMPEQGLRELRLSTVLGILSDRGSDVRVITRPGEVINSEFLRRLPVGVQVRFHQYLHAKMLITNTFVVKGSMNFAYSGVRINEESATISVAPDEISQALLEAGQTWSSLAT